MKTITNIKTTIEILLYMLFYKFAHPLTFDAFKRRAFALFPRNAVEGWTCKITDTGFRAYSHSRTYFVLVIYSAVDNQWLVKISYRHKPVGSLTGYSFLVKRKIKKLLQNAKQTETLSVTLS